MENPVSYALQKVEELKQDSARTAVVIADLKKFQSAHHATFKQIEKSCFNSIIQDLETPQMMKRGMGIKNPYPARFKFRGKQNFEALNDDKNGLVHGVIIRGKQHDLICKSFRWFEYQKIYYGKKSRGRWYNLVEELAGVCDLVDKSGKLLNTWTTAVHFQKKYENTSVELPDVTCITKKSFISGNLKGSHYAFNTHIEGFYKSNKDLESEGLANYDEVLSRYEYVNEDSLMLDQEFYDECRKNLYGDDSNVEIQKKWLVDPAYNLEDQQEQTFVVNSPYLKVYHQPETAEYMVLLPKILRKGVHYGASKKVTKYEGKAIWESKLYHL